MSGLFWIFGGGIAGWLTGKLIGEKSYGKILLARYTAGFDIILGIMGASVGGYLFSWAIVGQANSFTGYGTALLGSIALVGMVRQFPVIFRFSSAR